jgi:hypothetical protein
MSFNRADYEKLIRMARLLASFDAGEDVDEIAQDLFNMASEVIGQQLSPLFMEELDDH